MIFFFQPSENPGDFDRKYIVFVLVLQVGRPLDEIRRWHEPRDPTRWETPLELSAIDSLRHARRFTLGVYGTDQGSRPRSPAGRERGSEE